LPFFDLGTGAIGELACSPPNPALNPKKIFGGGFVPRLGIEDAAK
jgi:hypothetical protein